MIPQPGELLRLLSGNGEYEPSVPNVKLRRWAEAFDDWLTIRYTRFSKNVGPDSHRAWVEFLALTQKPPWEIQVTDVETYIKALEGRGLSAGTIHRRLTGLKSFYTFCQEKDPAHSLGRKRPGQAAHGTGINPVSEVKRPRVKGYKKSNYLSREEEAAFIGDQERSIGDWQTGLRAVFDPAANGLPAGGGARFAVGGCTEIQKFGLIPVIRPRPRTPIWG